MGGRVFTQNNIKKIMSKVYIAIQYGDRQDIVQYANNIKQAKKLIEKILPKLRQGYKYIII